MAKRIKLNNHIKKAFYAALLAGGITLVGCNAKTEANSNVVTSIETNAPEVKETKPIEIKKKEFTEADYIKSLADKVTNYSVDCVVDDKLYNNFLYNPSDKAAFYGVREQYGNRIATLTDSNIATPLSEDAISKLDGYLDKSIIDYTNDCEYVKLHKDELNAIYEQYKDFDFFRNGNYNSLHELDQYAGMYDTKEYSIRATQYAIEIINPNDGSIITIFGF